MKLLMAITNTKETNSNEINFNIHQIEGIILKEGMDLQVASTGEMLKVVKSENGIIQTNKAAYSAGHNKMLQGEIIIIRDN